MSLESRIQVARANAQVLYSEVQKLHALLQDVTLAEALAHVLPIPPKRYLRLYNTLKGHKDKIAQVRWAPDLVHLMLASQDGFIIIWDALSGFKLQAIPLQLLWVLCCAYSPSGRLVALAGLDNKCSVYKVAPAVWGDHGSHLAPLPEQLNLAAPQLCKVLPRAHAAYVLACEFTLDQSVLLALGDMTVALWDLAKGVRDREFLDHTADVLLLLKKAPGSLFLLCSADGSVKQWDLRQRGPLALFAVLRRDVNCVTQLHDGYSFVCGADDGLCHLYDLRSECPLAEYALPHFAQSAPLLPASRTTFESTFDSPGVVSVDVSISKRVMYACYADYGCIAWDVLKNSIIESIGVGSGCHGGRVSQVAVGPDGEGLATASWDSTVKVWSA